MRRTFTFILTLILVFSFCFPVNAQYFFQNNIKTVAESSEDTSTDTNSSAESIADSETSNDEMDDNGESENDTSTDEELDSDSDTNESSDTNPIGDSSSYYNVDNLKNSPDITAESAIIMDATTGAILYTKEADTTRYPASITKVMTALLAIENCDMDDIVTFSNEAVNGIEAGSSSAGINVGAELTVEDTLYALMLVSANEAAAALAEHISGSDEAFAELMTSRAKELGCTGTNFTNPHGLPDENHYTTAHDMALIMKQALKYEEFRTITSALSYTLEESDTLTDTLGLYNHAKLLYESSEYYYEYAEGAKTGYTQAAMNTLVTYAKKGNVELICVILKDYGADNSYYDTANLFTWAFKKVKRIQPLASFNLTEALENNSSIDNNLATNIARLNCTYDEDYYILVNKKFDESTLSTTFVYDEDSMNGRIGYINIYSDDTLIGSTPVTFDTTTEAAQNYLSSGETGDDLETAPVDEDSFTPKKLLSYIIRVIIAIALVLIIMQFVRWREAEKRRKERIRNRKKKHATSKTRTTQNNSSKTNADKNSISNSRTNSNSASSSKTNSNRKRRSRS